MAQDQIAELFRETDTSGDGIVSLKEIGRMFKSLGIKLAVKDVKKIVYKHDVDGSKGIDLEEFREIIKDVLLAQDHYIKAYEAFQMFDSDGSNTITADEVREAVKVLDNKLTEEEVNDMIKRMDADGNGIIDFEEFAKAYACGL